MFGTNAVVGRSHFKDAGDKIQITSIFLTIQGEGPYAGRPALFVRTTKCNLNCGFCDTFFDAGDWFTVEDLCKNLIQRATEKYNYVKDQLGIVFTGGEPSLQQNVSKILHLLAPGFAFTQIESNGILLLDNLPRSTTLVVSPKCNEKDGIPTSYLKPREAMLDRADCLKFVVSADADSPYHNIPDWALQWNHDTHKPIYISPMNIYKRLPAKAAALRDRKLFVQPDLETRSTIDEVVSFWEEGLLDREQNQKNHEYAARFALDNGLFLTLQMHLYASIA